MSYIRFLEEHLCSAGFRIEWNVCVQCDTDSSQFLNGLEVVPPPPPKPSLCFKWDNTTERRVTQRSTDPKRNRITMIAKSSSPVPNREFRSCRDSRVAFRCRDVDLSDLSADQGSRAAESAAERSRTTQRQQ